MDLRIPQIMAILNLNSDSFFPGSRTTQMDQILSKIDQWINSGMAILDLGPMSSRPGAEILSEEAEREIVARFLPTIRSHFPHLMISLDSYRPKVVEYAIAEGVDMINDISCLQYGESVPKLCAQNGIAYVLMHMRGNSQNMGSSENTIYKNVVTEVIKELSIKLKSLYQYSLNSIFVDPGFGFSKTVQQNYELLEKLEYFSLLEHPVLVGLSRKSMIYKSLETSVEHCLPGTIAAQTIALDKGAKILRVHDVEEARQLIGIWQKIHVSTD